MVKRYLDQTPQSLVRLSGPSLLQAIRQSEGRVVVAETVVIKEPLVDGCSNPELAAAFGADLLLLNLYDVQKPRVAGFLSSPEQLKAMSHVLELVGLHDIPDLWGFGVRAQQVKEMIGRPVGINLEPVPMSATIRISDGRKATVTNALLAQEQGVDFIVLTGNPDTGVTIQTITQQLKEIKKAVQDQMILMAGKMHGAGTFETHKSWITESEIKQLAEAGAQVLLLPQPGTVPGIQVEMVQQWTEIAHQEGMLVMLTIGTSQEGASTSVIEQFALQGKMVGGDLFHIGDAGFSGIALPENIMAYSIALKGRRHTYRRMAQSLLR